MLCSAHHVPDIMRGSFIEKGYRFNYTWQMCLKSVFRAHNETLNVWTHFIGFLIFAGLLIHTIYSAGDDNTPIPIFPSNFTFQHSVMDLAHKLYSEGVVNEVHLEVHPKSSRLPPQICHINNHTNFTKSFPAFSTPHAIPYSFSNYFSHEEHESDLHGDKRTFQAHVEHAMHTKAEELKHAMHTKAGELKHFLAQCRDHLQRKMNSLHDSLEIYLKDIEQSIHDFSNNNNVTASHLSERLSQMHQHFNENVAKFFSPKSKLPIMVFLFSGMVCFMFSTLYHTFGCQSVGHCAFFLKVDYSGISTLIAGSLVPFVWYVFHGLTHWQCFYVVTLCVLAALVLFVSFSERFSASEYQPYRALCFVLMAGFSIVPFLHMVMLYGTVEIYAFERCALSALLYILGVAAYVSRVPERLFPGKCDFWLQSHQVFHTFIVAAALVWYTFALRLLDSNTYIN